MATSPALRRALFLRSLGDEELLSLGETLTREEFARGQEIWSQGSTAEALYIIEKGSVEVIREEPGHDPQRLATLVPGDTLGEAELFARQPRMASARALAPAVLLRWGRRDLSKFLQQHPTALASLRFTALSRMRALRLRFHWLEQGETIHGLTGKHPILLYQGLFLPVLLLAIAGFLLIWSFSGGAPLAAWASAAVALVGFGFGLYQWIDWGNDYYIVTDRRAVWLEKVVGLYDSRHEAPLRMVLSVSTTTDVSGRMMDYGDVVIRTFTGQLRFHTVGSPHEMAAIIEELWRRAKEHEQQADKETIVETLHDRLGPSAEPAPEPTPPERLPPDIGLDRWTFQVRFEDKGVITYRKHWAVLLRATLLPATLILVVVGLLGARVGGLMQGLSLATTLTGAAVLLIPFILWWLYQYVDWANDIYQIAGDQIVDIRKKPLATEERKVAPLENILGTEVDRKGLAGLILNYGNVIANVGTTQFVFQGVYDPSGVQQDIVRAQEAFLERKQRAERDRRREEMVEWLGAYHREIGPGSSTTLAPDEGNDDRP
jgi:hypothetical protein